MKKGLMVRVITLTAAIVVLFIPMIPIDATYTETEPYDREARYEVVSQDLTKEYELFGRGYYHRLTVVVRNRDPGGIFRVTLELYVVSTTASLLFGSVTKTEYVEGGNTRDFVAEFDTYQGQEYGYNFHVTAPTVTDQRVVTKHKTVYKSIIELMTHG